MILLVLRLLLAAVFVVAAAGKLVARSRTVETLEQFGVTESLRGPLAIALPLAELAIAVALLPDATAVPAALAAAVLLAAFTAAVVRVLARGEVVDCNCFGSVGSSRITRWTAARNIALLAVAVTIAAVGLADDPGASAVAWLGDLDTAEAALLAAGVAMAFAALNFAFSWQLMRQNGRLLVEVAQLQDALGAARAGTRPGDPAPAFDLPALGGGRLSLEQLLSAGRGALIVVTDPSCGACDPLLPVIGRMQRDPETPLPLVMITRGDLEDNRAKAAEHGLEPVLIEREYEVSRALGINGAPGAVRLDADGRYAAKASMGAEKVAALLAGLEPADTVLTIHQGGI